MPLICHSFYPHRLGWGCPSVHKKSVKNSDLRHKATAKKNKRLLHIVIFILFYYFFFWRLLKKKIYFKTYFLIRILISAFSHPHFPIRILSSAFCHPHFVIRILLSAIRRPPSAIRHPPLSGPHFTETRFNKVKKLNFNMKSLS